MVFSLESRQFCILQNYEMVLSLFPLLSLFLCICFHYCDFLFMWICAYLCGFRSFTGGQEPLKSERCLRSFGTLFFLNCSTTIFALLFVFLLNKIYSVIRYKFSVVLIHFSVMTKETVHVTLCSGHLYIMFCKLHISKFVYIMDNLNIFYYIGIYTRTMPSKDILYSANISSIDCYHGLFFI